MIRIVLPYHLRNLAQTLAPGAVTIESGLSNAELGERYRAAHAFLCLSAHAGFTRGFRATCYLLRTLGFLLQCLRFT